MNITANKRKLIGFSAFVLFGLLVVFVLWRTSPMQLGKETYGATGLPQWTLAQAQQLAQRENKPLLIYFSAYWCPSCRQLDRKVLSVPEVTDAIQSQYVFVRLDSEAEGTRPMMKTYGLYGFPSLLIAQADGTLIKHLPNTIDPQRFLQSL